jgi:hypothetical protein
LQVRVLSQEPNESDFELSGPSVVTPKPASCGHFKTGQLNGVPGQDSYTSTADIFGNLFLKA